MDKPVEPPKPRIRVSAAEYESRTRAASNQRVKDAATKIMDDIARVRLGLVDK